MAARAKHGRVPDWLAGTPSPAQFFARLKWIDGRPLLDTIEPYRREIFDSVLWAFDNEGQPQINLALESRGKKNFKTADLDLAGAYRFFVWPSPQGNDCYVVCSDEDQAADNLDLFKKIIAANPILDQAVEIRVKEIVRLDGAGRFRILPRDIDGLHGKQYLFAGFDEIHTMLNYDVLEALAPDPTRRDALVWCTSYAALRHVAGIPLHDMLERGKAGSDPKMHFSWYSGSYTTDARLVGDGVTPEQRANPSMASWGNDGYLAQQKARLPSHKFRRLHLNEPAGLDGAAFDAAAVETAVARGRKRLPFVETLSYVAGCDHSGGSNDYAALCIGHQDPETNRTILDVLQAVAAPHNPRDVISRFAATLKEFNVYTVWGDRFGGATFSHDYQARGITYRPIVANKSTLYDAMEPALLAGELELLDIPELIDELMGLVRRGGKTDHVAGANDDHANAAAAMIYVARQREAEPLIVVPFVADDTNFPRRDRWAPSWGEVYLPPSYERDEYVGTSAWVRDQLARRNQ